MLRAWAHPTLRGDLDMKSKLRMALVATVCILAMSAAAAEADPFVLTMQEVGSNVVSAYNSYSVIMTFVGVARVGSVQQSTPSPYIQTIA
jgi:hypothetical protein